MGELVTAPIKEMYEQLSLALKCIDTDFLLFLKSSNSKTVCISDMQYDTGITICVRKSNRVIEDNAYKILDVSSLFVSPSFKKIGAALSLIKMTHRINPLDVTYLHQIKDRNVGLHLKKTGWLEDEKFNYYSYTNQALVGTFCKQTNQ